MKKLNLFYRTVALSLIISGAIALAPVKSNNLYAKETVKVWIIWSLILIETTNDTPTP